MKEKFFGYDVERKSWQERDSREWKSPIAEKLPVLFLLDGKEKTVWCPVHRTYEPVADFGKEAIRTADGCVLHGAVLEWGHQDVTSESANVIKIRLGYLQPFENRGIKNMHNTSRNEKMAWQTGGTGPPKKNI